MIVTLTGAFNNVGDHLIRDCAHRLITTFTRQPILDINRRAFVDTDYERLNKAHRVLLCGGPAYQRDTFPAIYNLDIERIAPPVIPYGLGWKSKLTDTVETFSFSPESLTFIRELHRRIITSSARDILTEKVLAKSGITNVIMTGCPAWYDLDRMDTTYSHIGNPQSIVYSAPAVIDGNSIRLLHVLNDVFPSARKFLALHHGYVPHRSLSGAKAATGNAAIATIATGCGYKVISLRADLDRMRSLYDEIDLHVGYRVHAHILRLSRRMPSILIAEDQRAISQTASMGSEAILGNLNKLDFEQAVRTSIDRHLRSNGSENQRAIETIRTHFPIMRDFVSALA